MIPKFRAWHKKEKRMFEITDLHWYDDKVEVHHPMTIYRKGSPGEPGAISENINYHLVGKDTILMQSTGLKDRNGKEIFEGDIVINKSFVHDARWESVIHDIRYDLERLASEERDREVIGNIHENPELLEEEHG